MHIHGSSFEWQRKTLGGWSGAWESSALKTSPTSPAAKPSFVLEDARTFFGWPQSRYQHFNRTKQKSGGRRYAPGAWSNTEDRALRGSDPVEPPRVRLQRRSGAARGLLRSP